MHRLSAAALLGLSFIRCGTAEAASSLAVHVQNNHLVDADGKTVRLLGVNRSGAEYMCVGGYGVFDGPVDAAAIAAIKAWHVNAVRVPLNEDCWLGINLSQNNQYIGAAYQQAIVAFVQALNDAGLYAILDLHWNAPGTWVANGQQPMADLDHGPAFWSSVAATFKNFPAVIFDLYNEPYVSTWDCWQNGCTVTDSGGNWQTAGMTQLVAAVRTAGATQPLMLGGLAWASDMGQWLAHVPVDPIQGPPQLVASYHSYCGPPGTSTVAACQQALADLQSSEWPVVQTLAASVPVVTGEFGEYDCATTYVIPYMGFADLNGISYVGWAWNTYGCGSFPALVSDYAGTPTAYGIGLKSHLAALNRSHATHDFDGDSRSDLLWRQDIGTVAVWMLAGLQVAQSGTVASVTANWQIIGQRDFNGDDKHDLLWRDTNTGAVAIWLMNGLEVVQSGGLGAVVGNWSVVGTGDFNGDGKGDILWRDDPAKGGSGTVAIWLMNGLQLSQSATLGAVAGNWTIVGTGDFNADGLCDVLWYDTASGTLAIWLMNGLTVLQAGTIGTAAGNWTVAGTGDFNGDGRSDILWRDSQTGTLAIWLMNGFQVLQAGSLGVVAGSWTVVETGDVDGDGRSDLIWRDTTSSATAVWLMNGLQIFSSGSLGAVGGGWMLQGLNAD